MKKQLLKILSILLLAVCVNCGKATKKQAQTTKEAKPNIVLFFVDDLGWSDLGFRNPVFETPNIDQLAAAGMSFEQAYIASPTCSPSRATLLTGKHPARLQMVRHIPGGKKFGFNKEGETEIEFHTLERDPAQFPSRNWLPLEHTTYAEALKDAGYYNLFVGKWHLGHEKYHPIHQGFDQQIGTSNAGHPKSYYPPYFGYKGDYTDENNTYLTDKLTNEAVDFIEKYEQENPFMLTFSYYSVHSPHQGRKDLVAHFKKKGLEDKYAHYAAMVAATDESVGRVLQALKDKGIEKETLILFVSDQGGYFENAPFRGGKMKETLFEGGARVPFFVYWHGVTKPNTKNNSVVQSTDIFSTLVELTGGNPSDYKEVDGISLLSTIRNNNTLEREPVYGYRAYEDLYVSVRKCDWKLLAYRSGTQKLFNIKKDIKEENDVFNEESEIANQLVEELKKWEVKMGVEKYSGVQ
ncbi:arylsulfatase A-like enzyme [Kordia periserrulae]|uniref:Arylsulfatase A-like enzyme n=1 Tax=Kordia periserrulae TaxID=701523 RepID=A0A2T6BUF5_9FLAO|nr:sulfatase [Kordia periserrulae]PTX59693.1 arylsulfatase A-like enzyme [Kordia periserrulae]